jgi:transposase
LQENAKMSTGFDTRPVFTTCRKEQEWIRMQAVKMYRRGMSAADIAAIFEITPRAVLHWVATFINCGQNGLVAKKVSGRPPKLNAE